MKTLITILAVLIAAYAGYAWAQGTIEPEIIIVRSYRYPIIIHYRTTLTSSEKIKGLESQRDHLIELADERFVKGNEKMQEIWRLQDRITILSAELHGIELIRIYKDLQ